MPKNTLALVLGIACLFVPCVPCVGSMLYMVCMVGTMIVGIMAIQECNASGESSAQAKIGMFLAILPIVLGAIAFVLYILFVVLGAVVSVVLQS